MKGYKYVASYLASAIDHGEHNSVSTESEQIEYIIKKNKGEHEYFDNKVLPIIEEPSCNRVFLIKKSCSQDANSEGLIWELHGSNGFISEVYSISDNIGWMHLKEVGVKKDVAILYFRIDGKCSRIEAIEIHIIKNSYNDLGLFQMVANYDLKNEIMEDAK
ncbi:hypothetical protein [Membranihabitans maritimus]|uniref:hypothetical protein n=1 Tax=Membranihabitans maritimus TaxID=2904244 RepID=UPI001F39FE55|nr:hypothetical protein [Membranihabitans maritimus]